MKRLSYVDQPELEVELPQTTKRAHVPPTAAECPYKAAFIDAVLEREANGGPIISPPAPRAVEDKPKKVRFRRKWCPTKYKDEVK